jgi:hypothetical protein
MRVAKNESYAKVIYWKRNSKSMTVNTFESRWPTDSEVETKKDGSWPSFFNTF